MNSPYRPVPGPVAALRRLVRWARFARLRVLSGNRLEVGKGVTFGADVVLIPPEFARFGDNVAVGRGFHLETNLVAGSDILFSSYVSIIGNDHKFDDDSASVFWAGRAEPATVIIEGNNLIGFGATIIGNVTIGRGCIVGARAVVTKDLPPDTVCIGSPAKVIRRRYSE